MPENKPERHNNIKTRGERKQLGQFQEAWRRLLKNRSAIIGMVMLVIIITVALLAPVLVDYQADCIDQHVLERNQKPSAEHWFGTDELGRDVFARVIYGARLSLFISLCAVAFETIVGTILGACAGYFGGALETVIMRTTDVFHAIPNLLLSICIAASLGQSLFNMILAIGIAGIPNSLRIVRANVLALRNQEYVEAGRALGGNDRQIIFSHIIPNTVAPLLITCTTRVAQAILSTSSLSYLGIGIRPPTPEWGNMLSAGRGFMREAPHLTLFPGIAIMVTVLAINLLGDGLRDALDPKMKR